MFEVLKYSVVCQLFMQWKNTLTSIKSFTGIVAQEVTFLALKFVSSS